MHELDEEFLSIHRKLDHIARLAYFAAFFSGIAFAVMVWKSIVW
jgi:hypothetical protein